MGGATTTSGSSGAGGGVAPAGRGRGGGVAGGTASVGSGGRPALSLLQIQEQEAAEQVYIVYAIRTPCTYVHVLQCIFCIILSKHAYACTCMYTLA